MFNIITAGNHAHDCKEVATRCGIHNVAFFDDDPDLGYLSPEGMVGDILIGIYDPILRREIATRFSHLRGTEPLIDPSATIGRSVRLGRGVVVAPNASVLHSVALKDHVHVNFHSSMIRCEIGAYSTISPAATICGNVVIGEACWIGAGSTICEKVTIGNDVVIGAGAVVPPRSHVPDHATVIGVFRG